MFNSDDVSDIKIFCMEFIMAKEIMEYGRGAKMFEFCPTFIYESAYVSRILPYDYDVFIRRCDCASRYPRGSHGSFESFLISIPEKVNDRYEFLEPKVRRVIDPGYNKDLMHAGEMRYLTAARILSDLESRGAKGGMVKLE
jgi:hypothetical protein